MLRHKKLLALILGGVMTTSVMLTGCGSSDKKAEGGAASEEPVNLVWYVIRGIEGLDSHHKIHSDFIEILARNLPIVIEVIESKEKINELIEILEPMIETGTITVIDNIQVISLNKKTD